VRSKKNEEEPMEGVIREFMPERESARECPMDGGMGLEQAAVAEGSATPWSHSNERMAQLVRTIEAEIIPRLMMAHNAAPPRPAPEHPGSVAVQTDDILAFAGLLLVRDDESASQFLDALRQRGMSLESVYIDVLAPTARHLGKLWEEDLCDFTQVIVGLARLQRVMRELAPTFCGEARPRQLGQRALLVPAPSEQHTFGLFMVTEFFRREGWEVWGEPPTSMEALAQVVSEVHFDLVGLSAGSERRFDSLAACVRVVREKSLNRNVIVMVGGPLFLVNPEFVMRVGADATAVDGRQAVRQAQGLMAMQARAMRS
jgi:methanogenic corrinoid protein MtbC1